MTSQLIDPNKAAAAKEHYLGEFLAQRGVASGDRAPRDVYGTNEFGVAVRPTGYDWSNTRTSDSFEYTDTAGKKQKNTSTWKPGDPFDTVTGSDGTPITVFNQWTARDNQQFHPYAIEMAAKDMGDVANTNYSQFRKDTEDSALKGANLQLLLMERMAKISNRKGGSSSVKLIKSNSLKT
jgi:hypothetical protein